MGHDDRRHRSVAQAEASGGTWHITPPRVDLGEPRAGGRGDAEPIPEPGEIGRYVLQLTGTGNCGGPNDGD